MLEFVRKRVQPAAAAGAGWGMPAGPGAAWRAACVASYGLAYATNLQLLGIVLPPPAGRLARHDEPALAAGGAAELSCGRHARRWRRCDFGGHRRGVLPAGRCGSPRRGGRARTTLGTPGRRIAAYPKWMVKFLHERRPRPAPAGRAARYRASSSKRPHPSDGLGHSLIDGDGPLESRPGFGCRCYYGYRILQASNSAE